MTEFVQTLKQLYLVNRKHMVKYAIFAMVGSVMGIVVMLCIFTWDDTVKYYTQTGMLASLVLSMLVYFFVGGCEVTEEFNLAISMGKTRKYFAPARYLLQVGNVIMMVIIALLTGCLEDVLYPFLYPGFEAEVSFVEIFTDPRVLLALVFAYTMLVLVIGALGLRFSYGKVYLAIASLSILFDALMPRILEMAEQEHSFLFTVAMGIYEFLKNSTLLEMILLVLVLTVAGLCGVSVLLRRQRVTG